MADSVQGIQTQPSTVQDPRSILEELKEIERKTANAKPRILRDVPLVVYPTKSKYGDFGNADEGDFEGGIAKRIAYIVKSSVVSLSSRVGDEFLFACSGTVIEQDDKVATVLTSASLLLGYEDVMPSNIVVMVHLPNSEIFCGAISNSDLHHNIAIITVPSMSQLSPILLVRQPLVSWNNVVAVGRNYETSELMAFCGEILLKDEGFDCEYVLSSSCCISTYGIGGPLIDTCSGCVIGIGFCDLDCTVFLPSNIVLRCLIHMNQYRKVVRPWLGIRTRDIDTLKLPHLEAIYMKFPDVLGVFVDRVMKGSPADTAGVCPGDVITHCDGIDVSSPMEFVELLFMKAERFIELSCDGASDNELGGRVIPIEVTIKRMSNGCTEKRTIFVDRLSPRDINRWPLIRSSHSNRGSQETTDKAGFFRC